MIDTLILGGIALVAVLCVVLVIARLYRRTDRDTAFVRTGWGGKLVVKDGGCLVLPIFHALAVVRLNTLILRTTRSAEDALITKDRLRADIGADFYVRVKPDQESIALAAQTLGEKTNDGEALRALIEPKLVDALRSVSAGMTLIELQEKRSDFVKAVHDTVASELLTNGLELESVSLTRLDQTDMKHFNPNNAFDAEGLARLTKITEERRKEVNDTRRAAEVAIAERDRDAKLEQLKISRANEEAELDQRRDIARRAAATRSETAEAEAQARQAEEAARIAAEQTIAEREEKARQAREAARIATSRAIQEQEIAARRDVELAEQERQIAIAERSRDESEARARAEEARALAAAAEEKVATAKAVEVAEREKRIAVLDAQKEAEIEATAVVVRAEADKKAALNTADAVITRARAQAEAAEIEAKGVRELGEANAAAEKAMNEARAALPAHIIEFEITRERLRIIPAAVAEAVRPLEKISDIRIIDAGGLGRSGGGEGGAAGGGGYSADALVTAALAHRAQAPILDHLLAAAGFVGADPVSALTGGLVDPKANAAPAAPAPAPETAPAPRTPVRPARRSEDSIVVVDRAPEV